LGFLLALAVLAFTNISSAQGGTLHFQGGIGVDNVIGQNPDSTIKLNIVRGVTPAAPG
jgi:hypothetical protein